MSYILDALRKSDQQRQRGTAPTLLMSQAALVPKPQSPGWLYGLLAVVLVCTGIFIGWLRPWQPEPRAAESVAVTVPGAGPRQGARAAPLTAPVREPTLQPAPVAAMPEVRAESAMRVPPAGSANLEESPIGAQTADAGAADAAAAALVVSMADLPISILQELPPVSISVHAYSANPKERLVGINNRLMHEGDSAAPGLVLEQITREGMILSYKGYRFRRGVQ